MNIVFFGNRQAKWLCDIYGELAERDDAQWIDIEAPLQARDRERLAAADVIATQANGRPLDFDATGDRVAFPEVALDFLWPFGGQPHLRNTRDTYFPSGPFGIELGDAYLNRRLQARDSAAAIETDYLALNIAAMLDLDAYKTLALERQAEIDRACGEDFASRLAAGYCDAPLFANPQTPNPDLLRDLANRLFAKLRARFKLTKDWRPDFSRVAELPVHPSVAAHFGLSWTKGRNYRTATGERIEFAEYVRRYLAYAEGPELEAGVWLVVNGRAEEGIAKLEIATTRPMGRRSTSARRAIMAAVAAEIGVNDLSAAPEGALPLFAEQRWPEAEAAVLAALAKTPSSLPAWLLLAKVRERRLDKDGRVAALRSAARLRPHNSVLQSRLARSLADGSDLADAIAAAEADVALNPNDPQRRALLAHLLERAGDPGRAKAELAEAIAIVARDPDYAKLRSALGERRVNLEAKRKL